MKNYVKYYSNYIIAKKIAEDELREYINSKECYDDLAERITSELAFEEKIDLDFTIISIKNRIKNFIETGKPVDY